MQQIHTTDGATHTKRKHGVTWTQQTDSPQEIVADPFECFWRSNICSKWVFFILFRYWPETRSHCLVSARRGSVQVVNRCADSVQIAFLPATSVFFLTPTGRVIAPSLSLLPSDESIANAVREATVIFFFFFFRCCLFQFCQSWREDKTCFKQAILISLICHLSVSLLLRKHPFAFGFIIKKLFDSQT